MGYVICDSSRKEIWKFDVWIGLIGLGEFVELVE